MVQDFFYFFYFDRYDKKKTERSYHFPEDTGCKSWFVIIYARTKLKCTINNSSPNSQKTIFKGYISTKGIFLIFTLYAPFGGNTAITELYNVLITRAITLNSANYKKISSIFTRLTWNFGWKPQFSLYTSQNSGDKLWRSPKPPCQ